MAAFLAGQAGRDLSYPVGLTGADPTPPGWDVDDNRIRLGWGDPCFHAARHAVQRWRMFDLDWVRISSPDLPAVGRDVCVIARSLGITILNACRVVRVEMDHERCAGFAYGTLPGHVEQGEERFTVERDPHNDAVWFRIRAVSRPCHPLARVGRPWVRRQQARFARDATAALLRAIPSGTAGDRQADGSARSA